MFAIFSKAGRSSKFKGMVTGVCVISLFACSQAVASPTGFFSFTTPFDTLSGGTGSDYPKLESSDVAVASDGKAKAAWIEKTGSGYAMKFAAQPVAGSSFGPATTVATSTEEPGIWPKFHGQTAVSQQGAAVFAWQFHQRTVSYKTSDGTTLYTKACSLYARVRLPDGRFSPITTLSTQSSPSFSINDDCPSDSLAVGISSDGKATVAWRELTDAGTSGTPRDKVVTSTYTPGGSFSTPESLTSSDIHSGEFHLAVSPSGATAITWKQSAVPDTGPLPSEKYVKAAIRPAGGTFTTSKTLETEAATCTANPANPVVSQSGKATFFWMYGCGVDGSRRYSLKTISSDETGTFSTEQTLGTTIEYLWFKDVDINDNGKIAVLALSHYRKVLVSEINSDGTFITSPLSTIDITFPNKIAISADGIVTIVGTHQDALYSASRKNAGSPFYVDKEYAESETSIWAGDIDAGAEDLATVLVDATPIGKGPLKGKASILASSRRNATPDDCVVPTLKGKSKTSALSAITAAKCEVGDVSERDPDDTPGRKKQVVVKQSVEPTTRLDGGSTIDIELAWVRY